MGQCQSANCKNDTVGNRKHCSTCRSQVYRQADPVRYFLNNLRESAAKRHIFFDLELEEFRAWCIKEQFKFGIKEHGARDSVDRKKVGQYPGYTINNIQKLTVQQNSQKYHSHDKHGRQWEPVPSSTEF
jgi:hypothetical protein